MKYRCLGGIFSLFILALLFWCSLYPDLSIPSRLWLLLGCFGCACSLLFRFLREVFPFSRSGLFFLFVALACYQFILVVSGPVSFYVAMLDGKTRNENF